VAEGDDVWWCYDGGNCVDDPSKDWLGGKVVKCTPSEAIVRVEGQLRDPNTHAPIGEQYIPVPLDRLRPDE
jgi:hypothetical protein